MSNLAASAGWGAVSAASLVIGGRVAAAVSLPERPAVIRLGTPAESAASPAPHLNPPRLIGNTGEPAEFVLPLENPNAPPGTKMDDFTHDALAWTLTAHEARPGPERGQVGRVWRVARTVRPDRRSVKVRRGHVPVVAP